ncbi:MAG: hypothetical protein AAF960_11995 [Bacteroidota bacterium]
MIPFLHNPVTLLDKANKDDYMVKRMLLRNGSLGLTTNLHHHIRLKNGKNKINYEKGEEKNFGGGMNGLVVSNHYN